MRLIKLFMVQLMGSILVNLFNSICLRILALSLFAIPSPSLPFFSHPPFCFSFQPGFSFSKAERAKPFFRAPHTPLCQEPFKSGNWGSGTEGESVLRRSRMGAQTPSRGPSSGEGRRPWSAGRRGSPACLARRGSGRLILNGKSAASPTCPRSVFTISLCQGKTGHCGSLAGWKGRL